MKRANGSGSVVNYGKGRRRPYAARVTIGWQGDKQQSRNIGFFETRQEAEAALADFIRSPYDIDARKMTMAELFERWRKNATDVGRLSARYIADLTSAFRLCASLHDTPYADIKAYTMQDAIDANGGMGTRTRCLFYQLDQYAMGLDIITKQYSGLTHARHPKKRHPRTVFSDFEAARLWDNIDKPWADTVLILLYSGWRASELLTLRRENVNLDMGIMRGGVKTAAGKDRIVPIHSAILPLVTARYEAAQNYLIEHKGTPITYRIYGAHFGKLMADLGMKHTIHETRHTFRSWLDSSGANYACANRIMGHVCADVGLQVYTHKTIEDLRATVELIQSLQRREKLSVSNG